MDSDRRHHLTHNSLANWLIAQYEDMIQPNSQLIVWLGIAFLVFVCGGLLTVNRIKENTAKAWQQYFTAFASPDPEASFQALIDAGSSGPAAAQSRLTFAQLLLNDAGMQLSVDKKKAEEKLEKSLMMFQAAQSLADKDDVRLQALFGAAMVHETLAACREGKNDLVDAEKKYKEVAERWPNTLYGRHAKKQLELFAKAETRSFYDFLASTMPESPKDDEFKVDINKTDPFLDGPTAFDPLKTLGGSDFMVPSPTTPETEVPKQPESTTPE